MRRRDPNRYPDNRVALANMFRTDRGDNEGGQEWDHLAGSSPDPKGDDDVDVLLKGDGTIEVAYK